MVTSAIARELLKPHGKVCSQPASDWTGAFPIPPAVERFYGEVGPLNVTIEGYGNPYFLPSLADLWQLQAGYRWNGLDKKRLADWPDDWLVVADEGGDPFIFVRSSGVILHAFHGAGKWDAEEIFPDLNTMAACLAQLGATALEAKADDAAWMAWLDDGVIPARYRELAAARLAKFLESKPKAEVVLGALGWD